MTRRMLIGALATARPAPPGTPHHQQIEGPRWTGLALDLAADIDLDRADDTAKIAQQQHSVLCHYVIGGDVLPIAMGAVFSDNTAIKAHLCDAASGLDALANRMAGHVEYTLALARSHDAPDHMARQSGAGHLRARRAKRDRLRSRNSTGMLQTIVSDLRDVSTAHRLRGAQPGRMGAIDLLIRRDLWSDCRKTLDAWAEHARTSGLVLTATGPYPPFSFIEGRAND